MPSIGSPTSSSDVTEVAEDCGVGEEEGAATVLRLRNGCSSCIGVSKTGEADRELAWLDIGESFSGQSTESESVVRSRSVADLKTPPWIGGSMFFHR